MVKENSIRNIIITRSELIYLQDKDKEYVFTGNQLEIIFNQYKYIGNLTFVNNTFKCGSRKIEIIFNITYTWTNIEYAPRFNFNILKNGHVYYSTYRGLSDTMTQNTLYMSVIVDIKQNDKLSFIFEKTSSDGENFIIADNSYYIVKTF